MKGEFKKRLWKDEKEKTGLEEDRTDWMQWLLLDVICPVLVIIEQTSVFVYVYSP